MAEGNRGEGSAEIIVDGAGEMAQKIRAMTALPEDLGWIPSTHNVAHNQLLTLFIENLMPSSGLLGYCMHAIHTLTCKHSYT